VGEGEETHTVTDTGSSNMYTVEAPASADGPDSIVREFVEVGPPAQDVAVDVAAATCGEAPTLIPVSTANAVCVTIYK